MTFEESTEWLYKQFRAYQHDGVSAYKPDIENIADLCHYFNVNYTSLKFVHVAGTNGKGSVSNYLASILQEAGYQTGLFTSPHILDFRERIRVNGRMISQQKVIDFCRKAQASDFSVKPSFFEITWVLALIHFIDEKCDICIIETGLGGRLDATNIIHPLLSIITSIGLDHTSILGDSIEKIAFEKAGIIKHGVPLVLGKVPKEAENVILEQAKTKGSLVHFYTDLAETEAVFPSNTYLFKNEQVVRTSCTLLNKMGFTISKEFIENGFRKVSENTGFRARFQQISDSPLILVDAAHNPDGVVELLSLIKKTHPSKKMLVVYGASNDKNVKEVINLFPLDTFFLFTCFSNQRSLSLAELQQLSSVVSYKNLVFPTILESYEYAKKIQNEDTLLLITGSFFLLSDFFSIFK